VAISVAVHVTGCVWLAAGLLGGGGERESAAAPVPKVPARVSATAAEAPLDVALFEERDAPPAVAAPERDAARPPPRARAIVHAPTVAAEPDAEARQPSGSLLAMRQAGADLRVHAEPAVAVVAPAPAPAGPAAAAGPLAPNAAPAAPDSGAPDPTETHEGFAVTVDPDGEAHIHDARNVRFVLHLPSKQDLGERLGAWYDRPEPSPQGDRDRDAHGERDIDDRPIVNPIRPIGVTVIKFDVSDWLMRSHGLDPYASQKLKVLDATRDERAQIGAQHERAQLGRAGELMQQNLDTLWATVRDPAARKRSLFELWDECAETGSEDSVAAGASARARVVKFVREQIPAGQPGAFTADELAALRAHAQSSAPFAPYE